MKAPPKDKVILGHVLKPLGRVWMTDDNSPFICLDKKGKRSWTITVGFDGNRFEADGPSEKKAYENLLAKVEEAQKVIDKIKSWSKGKP